MVNVNYIVLCVLIILPYGSYAQYFMDGQEPASADWYQIKGERFCVLYPQERDSTALFVINFLEKNDSLISKDLRYLPQRSTIVLHPNGTVNNGYVMWAPKRSEYFLAPSCTDVPEFSLPLLSLHEQRHFVQAGKIAHGFFPRLFYPLLGEQLAGAITGLYLPRWYLEGDAVLMESLLTNSGRGRMPSYSAPLLAQLDLHGRFTYNKAVFGSYRHFTADPYVLGYNMLLYARLNNGPDAWEHALQKTADLPFSVNPFNRGLKQHSGYSKNGIYKQSLKALPGHACVNRKARVKKDRYFQYRCPVAHDTAVISMKSGFSCYSQVCIDSPKEKSLFYFGRMKTDERIMYADGKLVWAQQLEHPRWEHKQISQVYIYDLNTKQKRRLKTAESLLSPSLSTKADKVAAIYVSESGEHFLCVVDSSANISKVFKADSYNELYQPFWIDNVTIGFVKASPSGKQLVLFDLNRMSVVTVLDAGYNDISFPNSGNGYVFFSGAVADEVRNIYALDLSTRNCFRLTNERYAADFPSYAPVSDELLFSSYTPLGYRTKRMKLDSANWLAVDYSIQTNHCRLDSIIANEKVQRVEMPAIDSFPVKKYHKIMHLFNVHSWMPFPNDFTPWKKGYDEIGLQFLSQNKLSSSLASAGYAQSRMYGNQRYFFNWKYYGWYPLINWQNSFEQKHVPESGFSYRNFISTIDARLKHTRQTGLFRQYMHFTTGLEYQNLHHFESPDEKVSLPSSIRLVAPFYNVYFRNSLPQRYRDIDSRFSQDVFLQLKHAVPGYEYDLGAVASAQFYLNLPSVFPHHVIKLYWGMQYKHSNYEQTYFQDAIMIARSYEQTANSVRSETYSVTYSLPLLNADFDLGWLLYMKRVRGALFYDYTKKDNNLYRSTGAELLFENFLLRIPIPFEMGIRTSYLIEKNEVVNSLLFNLALDKMP